MTDIVLNDRLTIASPLMNNSYNTNKSPINSTELSTSYRIYDETASRAIWGQLLPPQFRILRKCLESSTTMKILTIIYIISSIASIASMYIFYKRNVAPDGSDSAVASYGFNVFETLVIIAIPPLAVHFIRDIFAADDLPDLLFTAATFDPYLSVKFRVITYLNSVLIILSVLLFVITMPLATYERVLYAFFSPLYLMPFCYMYTMVLFVLEAHRQCIEQFLACLRNNIPTWQQYASGQQQATLASISIDDLRRQYIKLHYHCRTTSLLRGKHIFALFFLAVLFIIYTIWNLYQYNLAVAAMVTYAVGSLVTLHELGGLLASTNEAGNIVCRELSALLLYWDAQPDAPLREITILLQCINYAKLEIPFFGNFVLRPRTLIAVVGSALGAIIPGFVLQA